MGRTSSIAMMVVMGLMGSVNAAAEESDSLTVPVMVLNEVGIADETVRQAQAETVRIFKAAGITLTWLRSGAPSKRSLIIKIATVPPDQKGRNQNALGVAPSSKEARGHVAWLYYHRIEDTARLSQLEVSKLLGHAMGTRDGSSASALRFARAGWTDEGRLGRATDPSRLDKRADVRARPGCDDSRASSACKRIPHPSSLIPNPSGLSPQPFGTLALFDRVSRLRSHGRDSPGTRRGTRWAGRAGSQAWRFTECWRRPM